MPVFSSTSHSRLQTCHDDLQRLFNEVVKHFDCVVLCGHRGRVLQNEYFTRGKTQVRWPDGKHNQRPSGAVDVAPYPVNWKDLNQFYFFGGVVKGIALQLDIQIRWGGDWDSDNQVKDNNFNDLVHFELFNPLQ